MLTSLPRDHLFSDHSSKRQNLATFFINKNSNILYIDIKYTSDGLKYAYKQTQYRILRFKKALFTL